MKHLTINKANIPLFCMILVTAILITVTGIYFGQGFLRILPLYVSLFIMFLQTRVNRYAYLLGGLNSLLYAYVYWYYGLYASVAYAVLVSCPFQIATFILWSKRPWGNSTVFKKMTKKQLILVGAAFVAVWLVLQVVLKALGGNYQILDSTTSLLGILASILVMLAYVEHTYLSFPSGIIGLFLYATMLKESPEQITYLIYQIYAFTCTTITFFKTRKVYNQQKQEKEN